MTYSYNSENILARVVRGDLPADVLIETKHSLVIADIRPQAPSHYLVLPKGPFCCFDHFLDRAPKEEVFDFFDTARIAVNKLNLSPDHGGGGYRLIANTGEDGFQEIAHFHLHIVGGRWLGPLLPENTDRQTAQDKFGMKLGNHEMLEDM
nr:HIT domain-containing protein [Ruegeria atlantica]